MKKIYTKAAASILAAAVLSATGISALAADESCGWQSGKAQYESRHKIFTEAVQQADDSAREAFFAANGIGGDGPHSGKTRLDVEKLVEAGVIDQETAEEIRQYVSDQQAQRHAAYAEKSSMTNEERHSFYTGMHTDHAGSVEELLEAGMISQEQGRYRGIPRLKSAQGQEAVEPFMPLAQQKECEILCHVEPEIYALADAKHMGRVLYNLLDNGLRYTEKRLTVTIERRDQAARVEIRDDGPGIPAEDIPLVWERYFTSKQRGGQGRSGLGLAITKELLSAQKARFGVDSQVGGGTAFGFEVPIANE